MASCISNSQKTLSLGVYGGRGDPLLFSFVVYPTISLVRLREKFSWPRNTKSLSGVGSFETKGSAQDILVQPSKNNSMWKLKHFPNGLKENIRCWVHLHNLNI
jgi:hypothetical protein